MLRNKIGVPPYDYESNECEHFGSLFRVEIVKQNNLSTYSLV